MKSAFMIAAPTSGSGKTTIARGLMALFASKGMRVQPFKCGPDYIDTKFHEAVCGRPSINLDTFMATPDHIRQLFAHYGTDADVCIVEGMMGLFDGYDRDRGSSAEIARVLGLPVVLVVDAKSAAYSVAPLLQGFINFRKDVHIAGVIYNKVGSERHYQMLRQVCDDLGVTCFGFLPKSVSLEQDSRYLGLDFTKEADKSELIEMLEKQVDYFALGKLGLSPEQSRTFPGAKSDFPRSKVRALIARSSEAFSFLYQETLDFFGQTNFFNPETDTPCFDGIDLLYLPGGYPEKHLEALVANEACRRAIKDFAEQGGRIQAECGGMMYLCEKIVTDAGEYPMCGVLPYTITARQSDRRLSLGYRRFTLDGREYRGHEFHYTQFLGGTPPSVTQVYNAKGEPVPTPVFRYKNVLASYTHLYMSPKLGDDRGLNNCSLSNPHPPKLGDLLHPVMFAGTGSDVGKSIIAAAFCRIFRQDGYHPAPFKAQNMALNSYATPEGLEIGRAQAVQAEAAGIPCHTDMNPLLLKPQSDHTSQVVLNGKPIGNRDAYDFWRRQDTPPTGGVRGGLNEHIDFRREVCNAFDRLAARYNPIVMEGAGSISEINLKDRDLVNLPMARHADADVILVGDIDRGGVFASVYGSIMLQTPEDRQRIKGIIINKFRGDMRLFDEGRRMLEDICGIPVLGVIPYYKDIHIEEEDSVALSQKNSQFSARPNGTLSSERILNSQLIKVAVILLRHISNYTDFDAVEQDPRIHLFYTNNTDDIRQADIIILPGTKSTLHDLYELRRNGCAQAIVQAHREGATVLGICGGYQMMGVEVCDPDHVEGDIERLPGLGLLPITTTMSGEKITRQASFSMPSCHDGKGYEIHMGETRPFGDAKPQPLTHLSDGRDDGYIVSPKCMGTYLHGILDNSPFVDFLLQPFADKLAQAGKPFDYQAFKEKQYDLLADHVRKHVDMDLVYKILTDD